MKTTLDLDDALLLKAKTIAVERRTTLKAIVEHALRRELIFPSEGENPAPDRFETGPLGFLVLKRKPGETVTLRQIREIGDGLDDLEFQRVVEPRKP